MFTPYDSNEPAANHDVQSNLTNRSLPQRNRAPPSWLKDYVRQKLSDLSLCLILCYAETCDCKLKEGGC